MQTCVYIYIYTHSLKYSKQTIQQITLNEQQSNKNLGCDIHTVDFRNFIVFLGRDPGTLKSDIVSKNIHN